MVCRRMYEVIPECQEQPCPQQQHDHHQVYVPQLCHLLSQVKDQNHPHQDLHRGIHLCRLTQLCRDKIAQQVPLLYLCTIRRDQA